MSVRARVFTYDVSLDHSWTARSSRGGATLPNDEEEWSPEHLVLAGLCRCTLTSFRYHARHSGIEPVAGASAHGTVTKRELDGRFAFVEIQVAIDAVLDPAPDAATVRDLVAKGERDCFVGASLTVTPDYTWNVNGEELT